MKKFIPELDGLRGFGMVILLMAHFPVSLIEYNWILINGFYIMSGFLISRILLDEKNKQGTIGEKFKVYWFRRMLRIFPAYYLYLVILSVLFLLVNFPKDYLTFIPYLSTFTFSYAPVFTTKSEIGYLSVHLWSISVEEQFYIVLPLLVFALSQRWLRVVVIFFLFFSPLFRYLHGEYYLQTTGMVRGQAIYYSTFSYLDSFAMGIVINIFKMNEWKYLKLFFRLSLVVMLGAGLMNSISIVGELNLKDYATNLGYQLGDHPNYQYVWSYTLISIFFCFLIAVLVAYSGNEKSWLHKLFRFRPLIFLGTISYSVYIYHLGVLMLMKILLLPDDYREAPGATKFFWFLIYLGFMYLIGYLSFRFFESRFLKMKPKYLQAPSIEAPAEIMKRQKGKKKSK